MYDEVCKEEKSISRQNGLAVDSAHDSHASAFWLHPFGAHDERTLKPHMIQVLAPHRHSHAREEVDKRKRFTCRAKYASQQ